MRLVAQLLAAAAVAAVAGCTTTAHFKVPENTTLYLEERPAGIGADGTVTTRPYFWTSAPGIHYRLEKDGATVQRGRIPSRFRPVSIFWPPYALIYWPFGFLDNTTYDLVKGTNAIVYPPGSR
jgi:hypothetical protein